MSSRAALTLASLLPALVCIHVAEAHIINIWNCKFVWDEPCNSQIIKFYLYTRRSRGGEYTEMKENGQNNITSSQYDQRKRSIIIIHGYRDTYKQAALQVIKEDKGSITNKHSDISTFMDIFEEVEEITLATDDFKILVYIGGYIGEKYLKMDDVNIWFMNWESLVATDCYFSAVFNIKYAGKCLASFTTILGKPKENYHVIGFSLGGHVAGLAATYLKPYLIPRVTGLDPALPLFIGYGSQKRLGPESGKFVDVYHTNAFMQGNFLPLGHVDFFINGGVTQPGCDSMICSHLRAPLYFAESINSAAGFWGWQCKNYFQDIFKDCPLKMPLYEMGDLVNTTARGLMYVQTNAESPYAKGKPQLEEEKYEVHS